MPGGLPPGLYLGVSENVLSSVEVVEPVGWWKGWKNFVNKTRSQQEGSGLVRTKCSGRERPRKGGTEGLSSSLNGLRIHKAAWAGTCCGPDHLFWGETWCSLSIWTVLPGEGNLGENISSALIKTFTCISVTTKIIVAILSHHLGTGMILKIKFCQSVWLVWNP